MTQMTSGKVLRETRERKGYDLTTVARRLRIRPDILRAIEAGDFAAMPPRGYTRNMVNAYARLLGLNPTEIVNMYLDEVYAEQVAQARGRAPSSGFNMERDSFLGRSRNRSTRDATRNRDTGRSPHDDGGSDYAERGRYGRALYDDRTKFSRDDYGITRERMERPGKSDRDFLSHHSGYMSTDLGFLTGEGRNGGRTVHVGETPMEYKASRLPGFMQSRLVLGIGIVVIVAIVLVLVFGVFGNKNKPAADDVSQLPVSGINDTTGTADDETATGLVEVAPTSSRVVMTVNQGDECYIETHKGDVTTPYMLTGPAQESFEVTDVVTIATFAPDFVTVTVDGTPVTLNPDDNYQGMSTYTVDFPAILEQWRATHTSREAQRSAALATAENNAAQSASSQSASASEASGASQGSASQ